MPPSETTPAKTTSPLVTNRRVQLGSAAAIWTLTLIAELVRPGALGFLSTVILTAPLWGLVIYAVLNWRAKPQGDVDPWQGRLANDEDIERSRLLTFDQNGVPLGRTVVGEEERRNGMESRATAYCGGTSIVTAAPAGAGKGRDAIIPALLSWQDSCVVFDIKGGENACVTARRREEMGQTVLAVDPWGVVTGHAAERRARFNPMAAMTGASPGNIAAHARVLADALVVPSSTTESHWDDSAGMLLGSLIEHAATTEPAERQNLLTVREYLTEKDFPDFLLEVAQNPHSRTARNAAAALYESAEKERATILAAARKHTHWLDDPHIRETLSGSDFSIAELKDTPTTVYVCMDSDQVEVMVRWLRLILNTTVSEIMKGGRGKHRVLAIADEFAALGRMRLAERAVAEGRASGLMLWSIVQTLSQLKDLYGDTWETFVANAGMLQILACNDLFTADYASRRSGTRTMRAANRSYSNNRSSSGSGSSSSTSYNVMSRAVLTSDEIITRLGRGGQLVYANGEFPLLLWTGSYLRDPRYAGQFDPNPFYQAPEEPVEEEPA